MKRKQCQKKENLNDRLHYANVTMHEDKRLAGQGAPHQKSLAVFLKLHTLGTGLKPNPRQSILLFPLLDLPSSLTLRRVFQSRDTHSRHSKLNRQKQPARLQTPGLCPARYEVQSLLLI